MILNLQPSLRGFVFDENRPAPSCHASTLAKSGDTLFCAWFAGSRESAPDTHIYLSRYREGIWSSPEKVSVAENTPHWNPVLFAHKEKLYLFYKEGYPISAWKTLLRVSEDGGKTFSPPRELVAGDETGGRGPVKNKPLLLSDGSILCPASREYADSTWRVFADRTADAFGSLTRSDFILPEDPSVRLIQPSFWEDKTGVHALFRSDREHLYRADSSDLGLTWSKAYPISFPNNNSGFDLVAVPDGRIFLVSNPVAENWGFRSPLTLSVSEDGGQSFRALYNLEYDRLGEYSYPSIIYDHGLRISYTHRRERIAFAFWDID